MTGRRLLAALGLWVVSAAAVGGATIAIGHGTGPVMVVVVAEVYVLLSLCQLAVCGPTALALTRPRGRDLGYALAALAGAAVAAVAIYAVVVLAAGSSPGQIQDRVLRAATDMDRLPHASAVTLTFIIARAAVITGAGEELLFRGALWAWLRRHLGPAVTIVLTTALFVAVHARPIVFPVVAMYGLAAGWVRHRTGSTVCTMVMHGLTDSSLLVAAAIVLHQGR